MELKISLEIFYTLKQLTSFLDLMLNISLNKRFSYTKRIHQPMSQLPHFSTAETLVSQNTPSDLEIIDLIKFFAVQPKCIYYCVLSMRYAEIWFMHVGNSRKKPMSGTWALFPPTRTVRLLLLITSVRDNRGSVIDEMLIRFRINFSEYYLWLDTSRLKGRGPKITRFSF